MRRVGRSLCQCVHRYLNLQAQVVPMVKLHDKQGVHHMLSEVTLLKTESFFENFAHLIRQELIDYHCYDAAVEPSGREYKVHCIITTACMLYGLSG